MLLGMVRGMGRVLTVGMYRLSVLSEVENMCMGFDGVHGLVLQSFALQR